MRGDKVDSLRSRLSRTLLPKYWSKRYRLENVKALFKRPFPMNETQRRSTRKSRLLNKWGINQFGPPDAPIEGLLTTKR